MRQIYDFEQALPPVLTEARLRKQLEQRQLRIQTMMLSLGGLLMQLCLLVLAMTLYRAYPLFSALAVCYLLLSTAGAGILAVVFWRQRRYLVL